AGAAGGGAAGHGPAACPGRPARPRPGPGAAPGAEGHFGLRYGGIIASLISVVIDGAAGWSSSVARWAHNPEVAGSNPAPATKEKPSGPAGGLLAYGESR